MVNVISLPYIFQGLYALCFTQLRYQVSVLNHFLILPETYQYEGPKHSFQTPGFDVPYLYMLLPSHLRQDKRVRLKKPRVLLALVQILLICVFHFKSLVIAQPRSLILSTFLRTVPYKV